MHALSSAIAKVERRMGQLGHEPALTAIPELYGILGEEQKALWDKAERDLEEAGVIKCEVLLAVAASQYELVMFELIDYAVRKIRHARIAQRLRKDCWMAREEA
jgi:hypothetical protein